MNQPIATNVKSVTGKKVQQERPTRMKGTNERVQVKAHPTRSAIHRFAFS